MVQLLHGAMPATVATVGRCNTSLKNVQPIKATWAAFAAILANGAVRHQLKNVQQIRSTAQAFAAMLADGSVVFMGPSNLWRRQ